MTIDDVIEKMEEFGLEVKYIYGPSTYQLVFLNHGLVLVVYFDLSFELMAKNINRIDETEEPFVSLRWPSGRSIDSEGVNNQYDVGTTVFNSDPFREDQFFSLMMIIKRMVDV